MEQKQQQQLNNKIYTLDLIREEKRIVRQQINESNARIHRTYKNMIAPPQEPQNKMQSFMNVFDQGMMIYDGVMMGMRIARTIKSIFVPFRKKKKW